MRRKILGTAAALGAGAAMLFGVAAPAHASGGDCGNVRNGNSIIYVWPDTSFTFECRDGFWVFIA
jgi:hypothetical protein